jgi:oligoendopeptidase F
MYRDEIASLRGTPELVDRLENLVAKYPGIELCMDLYRAIYPFPLDKFQEDGLSSLINGNNVQEALKKLNCNIDTNDNIYNIITKRTTNDIEDEKAKLEYINRVNYQDPKVKEEAIKKSTEKIASLKERLKNIKERILRKENFYNLYLNYKNYIDSRLDV